MVEITESNNVALKKMRVASCDGPRSCESTQKNGGVSSSSNMIGGMFASASTDLAKCLTCREFCEVLVRFEKDGEARKKTGTRDHAMKKKSSAHL